MKKKYLFYLLEFCICMLFLCSFSKNNTKIVKGYITVFGNDPFAFIGIQTLDKKEYAIISNDDIYKELWNVQGKTVEIEGNITKSKKDIKEPGMLKDGKIEVIEWKVCE